jgi:hypothetical protein
MRIALGINGFPFYPGIIGSRPLHDADARRNTGTHACAHPYRRTTTTMKKSDHQRRTTLSENVIHVGTGFVAKERPHVVEALSTLGPHFVTGELISSKDFTVGWDDEIKAEQRAASDQTAELQRRRIASCRRYADVIDKAAPEIARSCRNLGVKSEGIKWLIEPKQWVFEIGPGAHITIKSTGKWYFSDPTAQRLHEKVDKYYYWEKCETHNDERIIEDLKAQVEKKAMPRRPIVYKQHWRLVH